MAGKTDDATARLSSPEGRNRGPRALGSLLPRLTRPAFRRRGTATIQLAADWPAVVGPEIATLGAPVRLNRGTLTIAATGPGAMELNMLAPLVMERVNAHLGRAAVTRLGFVQQAPRPDAPAPRRAPPAAALPDTAAARLDSLPEGELRDALSRLAAGIFRARG